MRKPINERFAEFHADNPHVYRELRRLSFELLDAGNEVISMAMLFEHLRFSHLTSRDRSSEFKLDNSYRAYYARLLMEREARLQGRFRLRELTALQRHEDGVFTPHGQGVAA